MTLRQKLWAVWQYLRFKRGKQMDYVKIAKLVLGIAHDFVHAKAEDPEVNWWDQADKYLELVIEFLDQDTMKGAGELSPMERSAMACADKIREELPSE